MHINTESIGGALMAMQFSTSNLTPADRLNAALYFTLMLLNDHCETPDEMRVAVEKIYDRLHEWIPLFMNARLLQTKIGGNA